MTFEIDTPAKRSRLALRKNPYWQSVAGGRGGVSLGYRPSSRGPGAWIAKTVVGGRRAEERVGLADDPSGPADALDYKAAVAATLEWSKRQHAAFEANIAGSVRERSTVFSAVESYIAQRRKRSKPNGDNARGRLTKHVLSDRAFAATHLSKLRSSAIEKLRDSLVAVDDETEKPKLSSSSVNRLFSDLRAALNAEATKHRRELPAHVFQEIRLGTKRLEAADTARRQLLTDVQIVALVDAAFEVDDTGDFGRLVTVLAASGARHSQAAALRVFSFQHNQQRLMMPGSRKGRSRRAKPTVAIQLAPNVCARLLPAIEGRDSQEPLLERWHHVKKGRFTWERAYRRAWGTYDAQRYWPETIKRAGVPAGTVPYAFRHSSIVRGLRANLPVRLVAALHDTSVEMIEAHYAAFIVDATEDLAKRASLSLSAVA